MNDWLTETCTTVAMRHAGDIEHLFGITDLSEAVYFLKGLTFVSEYQMSDETRTAADDVLGFLSMNMKTDAALAAEIREAMEDADDGEPPFADRDYMDSLT